MGTSRPTSARILKMLGFMSTTTGALGVLFTVVGQLVRARREAFHINTGHPVMDDETILYAPVPGLLVAVVGIGLGMAGLRSASWERTWAKAGIVTGAIALFLALTGLPVALMPNPWVEPMVR